ncbi:MAG: FAD-dependent oxidoreductase [Akkermansiaceae bacterium]|nr:FAD-dependent oxidoreductase [Verrucomicrobiales bacterium]
MQTKSNRPTRTHAARTPLFKSLRRLFSIATLANKTNRPPADELLQMPIHPGLNRREFLRTTALAAAAVGAGSWLTGCAAPKTGPNAPKIAIVGGGISGLNAAYNLRKRGWLATVYEASSRTGGRMYSAKDLLNPGLTTELGGEFVDSTHEEMLALASEFRLEWLDMHAPGEEHLVREAYYFEGAHHTEAQVVDAFRPLAARIKADFDKTADVVDFEHEGGAGELDRTSLADYFEQIGAQGWIRKLLDVAFVTEFGLECGEQSALNLIFMISTDLTAGKLELFGDSDERFKIIGGNQRIVDELARRVQDQIQLEQRLAAIVARDRGCTLVFDQAGRTTEVNADFVLLTLPFTMLRQVEIKVELPAWKQKAIAELGYGLNAKLLLGVKTRIWRDQGHSGNVFSDEPFQLAWDNSRLQPGTGGGVTCYSGGNATADLGRGTPQDQARRMLTALEKPFPGIAAEFNGKAERFFWPTHPFTRASYACYRPGQWTTIANAEGRRVGSLFFAGEHCSYDFQGFMNGGAETGKQAAVAIQKALRGWRTHA